MFSNSHWNLFYYWSLLGVNAGLLYISSSCNQGIPWLLEPKRYLSFTIKPANWPVIFKWIFSEWVLSENLPASREPTECVPCHFCGLFFNQFPHIAVPHSSKRNSSIIHLCIQIPPTESLFSDQKGTAFQGYLNKSAMAFPNMLSPLTSNVRYVSSNWATQIKLVCYWNNELPYNKNYSSLRLSDKNILS